MFKRLDGIVIFGTEQYGFNKTQVGEHLAEIGNKYEKLRKRCLRLIVISGFIIAALIVGLFITISFLR